MNIEWNGIGLPPVGTLCKLAGESEYLKPIHPEWEGREVKVYAHFKSDRGVELAAYVSPDHTIGGCGIRAMFRPIKTPEQIAAEKRKQEVEMLAADIMAVEHVSGSVMAERLYALGYRKVEGGEA